MAEDKSLRVVVTVNPARHPELFRDMQDIDNAGRAERLRSLSLLALVGAGGGVSPPSTQRAPSGSSLDQGADGGAEDQRNEGVKQESESQNASSDVSPQKPDPHKDVRASALNALKNTSF